MHRPAKILISLLSAMALLATAACSAEQPAAEKKSAHQKMDTVVHLTQHQRPNMQVAHYQPDDSEQV